MDIQNAAANRAARIANERRQTQFEQQKLDQGIEAGRQEVGLAVPERSATDELERRLEAAHVENTPGDRQNTATDELERRLEASHRENEPGDRQQNATQELERRLETPQRENTPENQRSGRDVLEQYKDAGDQVAKHDPDIDREI
jgi:hypothetical protein